MARHHKTPYSVYACRTKPYNMPVNPKKHLRKSYRGHYYRHVNTEVHDALFSLGANDRTAHLSQSEFQEQLTDEIGYLFDLGISHLGQAFKSIISVGKQLFNH